MVVDVVIAINVINIKILEKDTTSQRLYLFLREVSIVDDKVVLLIMNSDVVPIQSRARDLTPLAFIVLMEFFIWLLLPIVVVGKVDVNGVEGVATIVDVNEGSLVSAGVVEGDVVEADVVEGDVGMVEGVVVVEVDVVVENVAAVVVEGVVEGIVISPFSGSSYSQIK